MATATKNNNNKEKYKTNNNIITKQAKTAFLSSNSWLHLGLKEF